MTLSETHCRADNNDERCFPHAHAQLIVTIFLFFLGLFCAISFQSAFIHHVGKIMQSLFEVFSWNGNRAFAAVVKLRTWHETVARKLSCN